MGKQIIISDEEYERLVKQDGMITAAQNYIDTASYPELDVLAAIIGLDLECYYQNKREEETRSKQALEEMLRKKEDEKTCTSVFLKM